jgi:hypothetical protein
MVLKAMPTGRANARPMTGSASSGGVRAARLTVTLDCRNLTMQDSLILSAASVRA